MEISKNELKLMEEITEFVKDAHLRIDNMYAGVSVAKQIIGMSNIQRCEKDVITSIENNLLDISTMLKNFSITAKKNEDIQVLKLVWATCSDGHIQEFYDRLDYAELTEKQLTFQLDSFYHELTNKVKEFYKLCERVPGYDFGIDINLERLKSIILDYVNS